MCNGTVIVPAGATYSATNHGHADITLNKWLELQLADSTTALSCAITFDKNSISEGDSTTIHWDSEGAALFLYRKYRLRERFRRCHHHPC
jgi:hypothetical protein